MVKVKNHRSPWTKKEEQYISKNFGKISIKDMAKNLGRTVSGVSWKRSQLKIVKSKKLSKKVLGGYYDNVKTEYNPPERKTTFRSLIKRFLS